jgi:prevent-host-death family protein
VEVINVYEAKTRLSELIRDALAGKTVIISRHGVPMIQLVPVRADGLKREMGFFSGSVKVEEDFDAPLDDFKDYD